MGRGRPPKCKICGATLRVETAYMVVTRNKNGNEKKAFYCNQEEYEKHSVEQSKPIKEKKIKKEKTPKKCEVTENKQPTDKDIAYRLICDIIGKPKIINTALWKEWKVWNEVASDNIIKQYLIENKEYLMKVMLRLDSMEYGRIRYLSAILKNNLGDFKPKQEVLTQQIKDEHYVTKFKLKERVALLDIEEECYE